MSTLHFILLYLVSLVILVFVRRKEERLHAEHKHDITKAYEVRIANLKEVYDKRIASLEETYASVPHSAKDSS